MTRLIFAIVMLVFIPGCTTHPPSVLRETTALPTEPLSIPPGEYNGLVWLDHGLVIQVTTTPPPNLQQLRWVSLTNGIGERLPLPAAEGFLYTDYRRIFRLPDGRLGFITIGATPTPSGIREDSYTLHAFDPDTGQLEILIDDGLEETIGILGQFVWDADMRRAFVTTGGQLKSNLYWWTAAAGFTPFDADLTVSRFPAGSPDGTMIAIAGKPDAAPSLSTPANLYLMDAGGSNKRMLLANIGNFSGLSWSPTGAGWPSAARSSLG